MDKLTDIEVTDKNDNSESDVSQDSRERVGKHFTSTTESLIHFLKGNIGPGMQAIPHAVRNAGLATGTVGLVVIGLICSYSMHLITECAQELCQITKKQSVSFSYVGESILLTGPESIRKYSKKMRFVIDFFIVVTQLGFCSVYFVYISANIEKVVKYHNADLHWPLQAFMACLIIPFITMVLIKNLKRLAPVSLLANLLVAASIVITFTYLLTDMPDVSERKQFSSWKQLPLYFGTATYAFEGIALVLPIENQMKYPDSFTGWGGVLPTGMFLVTAMFTLMGFFGYLKYGDAVEGSITLNLPEGDILAQTVQILMAVGVCMTYPIQFYPAYEILWSSIQAKVPKQRHWWADYLFRSGIVLLTFLTAASIPNIGIFISLVGSVSSSVLALIIPPVLHVLTFYRQSTKFSLWLYADVFVIVFGLVGFVTGTYSSIDSLVDYFGSGTV